jgi:hypothetical protein
MIELLNLADFVKLFLLASWERFRLELIEEQAFVTPS